MGVLQIDILGTSFAINAKEDSDYLKKLLDYYAQTALQVEKTTDTAEPLQTAILAGMMICDELYKEKLRLLKIKKQVDTEALAEAEKLTSRIIDNIDKAMG